MPTFLFGRYQVEQETLATVLTLKNFQYIRPYALCCAARRDLGRLATRGQRRDVALKTLLDRWGTRTKQRGERKREDPVNGVQNGQRLLSCNLPANKNRGFFDSDIRIPRGSMAGFPHEAMHRKMGTYAKEQGRKSEDVAGCSCR